MSALPRKISAARALISLLPALLLAACSSSSTPAITAITLSPTTLTLTEGATHPALAVSSVDSAGTTATVTTGIAWSSSATPIASVDATSGVITAGAHAGTATITATITASGANISNSATVTVTAPVPTLTGIAVAPGTLALQIGATATGTLAVNGHYSDSSTAAITSGITWSSSSAAVASVSSAGLVTGSAAGSATITASVAGPAGALTAQATVTVAAAAAVSSYAIVDFNTALGSGFAYAITAFGGSISSITSSGVPSGGPSTAGPKFASITIPGAGGPQCFAGATLSVGYNASIGQVPFTTANATVKMAIYVPTGAVGNVIDVKFEDANDPTHSVETRQTFAASGWQTLTFDLSMQATGTAALNTAFTFDKVSVFPDFTCVNSAPEPGADEVFYIASLTFIGASAPAAPPLSAPPPPAAPTTAPTAPTLTAAQVIYILSSYFTAHSGTPHAIDNWSEFSGSITAAPAPVTIAGDAMYEFQFSAANGYDGISFGDQAANTANQVNATGKTAMHMDVWFSTASAFKVQLIDNAAAGGAVEQFGAYTVPAATIPAKTWVSLDITFAQLGLTTVANLQQIILQPTAAATNVYLDNLYFH